MEFNIGAFGGRLADGDWHGPWKLFMIYAIPLAIAAAWMVSSKPAGDTNLR